MRKSWCLKDISGLFQFNKLSPLRTKPVCARQNKLVMAFACLAFTTSSSSSALLLHGFFLPT